MKRVLLVSVFFCTACTQLPRIKVGDASVAAPRDAGTPAVVDKAETKTAFTIPAQTRVVTTRVDAVPATKDTPYFPARTTTEWTFLQPTEFEQIAAGLVASTGTIDTSVAKHRIDAQQREKLLYVAIGCGLLGVLARSLLPEWPIISNGLFVGALLAGAAWKLSELPAWLWAAVLVGAVLVAFGYKRAEWDRDGDGIPDLLQKTKS